MDEQTLNRRSDGTLSTQSAIPLDKYELAYTARYGEH